jgi:hypothetical protein
VSRSLDSTIAEQFGTTLGLVTLARLDALGVSRQRRRTLVAKGVLVPVHRGVARHAAHPESWQQRVLAAVQAAGDGAVASHATAGRLWRLDAAGPTPGVEVSLPPGRQCRPLTGVGLHRCSDLGPADVGRRGPIPCTTVARTLLDLAPALSEPALEAALDDAERRGLVWRPHLRWRIVHLARPGRAGVRRVERLLDRTDGRLLGDSWLEQAALRLVARSGLPVPRCQVKLRQCGGGIARVDLCWDDARLVVELDGHGSHATRRRRQADAERSARLGLAGWQVVRFTYEDVVERPGHVVAMIRSYLLRDVVVGGQPRRHAEQGR